MSDKVAFEDVTDQWESKTRGGYEVLRVEFFPKRTEEENLMVITRCDDDILVNWNFYDGRFISGETDGFDFIPKTHKSPWDGIPLDAWWQHRTCYANAGIRIVEFNANDGSVLFGDGIRRSLDEVKANYLHSSDPMKGPWKKVGE